MIRGTPATTLTDPHLLMTARGRGRQGDREAGRGRKGKKEGNREREREKKKENKVTYM